MWRSDLAVCLVSTPGGMGRHKTRKEVWLSACDGRLLVVTGLCGVQMRLGASGADKVDRWHSAWADSMSGSYAD